MDSVVFTDWQISVTSGPMAQYGTRSWTRSGGLTVAGGPPEDGNVIVDYKEYFIATHFYNTDFNIFEAIIRAKIYLNEIEISDTQLERICNPVLSDNNKSLLHHLSYRRLSSLQKLFDKTNIGDYGKSIDKRFIFFLDFEGESPLDKAIKKVDIDSFKLLLCYLIEY